MKEAFDHEKYLKVQKEKIEERIKKFDNKLYLEFGGKLFDDLHAARVLPGFRPDAKIELLKQFKNDLEVIFCINANDIEKNKIRADYGISYEQDLLRLIDKLKKLQILVSCVAINMYTGQKGVDKLVKDLNKKGVKSYLFEPIDGYPNDIEKIFSKEGFEKNPYIETTKKLVVITAPGPNSGKLATCLSQLYHENKKQIRAGYAKYETFPVWNLGLLHPVNIAYEAATADLGDINMIDPFHLQSYNIEAVNYNRDISTFPILKKMLKQIMGEDIYNSPTDMGVNMIKECIVDDEEARRAGCEEVIRRYYSIACDIKKGIYSQKVENRISELMTKLNLKREDRNIVEPTLEKAEKEKTNVVAIKLENGKIITGKESKLLSASSAMLINSLKELSGIPDEEYLLSPEVLEGIFKTKQKISYRKNYYLNIQEVLITLSICSKDNKSIEKAMEQLEKLNQLDAHSSYIVTTEENNVMKNLGIRLTCEPKFDN